MMDHIFHFIVLVVFLFCLFYEINRYRMGLKNKTEMDKYKSDTVLSSNFGKVLVIYFSLTNQTKNIAYQIMKITDGNIYEIRTVKTIKCCICLYLKSKIQIMMHKYPEIIKDFPDISSYDTIFIGTPVWWYTVSMPVTEYLKLTDFRGKKVIPFSTQASNCGNVFKEFEKQIKNAQVLQGCSFNNLDAKYTPNIRNKIITWLNNVKLSEKIDGGGKNK